MLPGVAEAICRLLATHRAVAMDTTCGEDRRYPHYTALGLDFKIRAQTDLAGSRDRVTEDGLKGIRLHGYSWIRLSAAVSALSSLRRLRVAQ